MPLIDLKTDLKSLKFGRDKRGGGSSNQPYIQREIPEGDLPVTSGPDFLLRNGFLAPADALRDVSRLAQMFFDLRSPRGLLFTAKENLLSRTAVKTEASFGAGYGGGNVNAGIYTPLSTLAQAGVGFAGGHLNLLGLDPSSPMAGVPQGIPGVGLGLNNYYDVIKAKNDPATFAQTTITKTVKVANPDYIPPQLILGSEGSTEPIFPQYIDKEITTVGPRGEFDNRLVNLFTEKQNVKNEDINVLQYDGGPGSVLGVGQTSIRFADQRTGENNSLLIRDPGYFLGTSNAGRYTLNPQTDDLNAKLGATIRAQQVLPNTDNREALSEEENPNRIKQFPTALNRKEEEIQKSFRPVPDSGDINTKLGVTTKASELLPDEKNKEELLNDEYPNRINKVYTTLTNNPLEAASIIRPAVITRNSQLFSQGVSRLYSDLINNPYATGLGGLINDTDGDQGFRNFETNVYTPPEAGTFPKNSSRIYDNGTLTFTQEDIINYSNTFLNGAYNLNNNPGDFRSKLIQDFGLEETGQSSVLSLAPNYQQKSINKRLNMGDPGASNTADGTKNVFNYGIPSTEAWALDKITAMPMYEGIGPDTSQAYNDLAKFRIAAINNDKTDGSAVYMHFRAFIDSFNDSYMSTWNPTKFSGRGDDFYTYGGFGRTLNIGFTVPAQSKAELVPMYKKLNYLASTLAPDYNSAGYMRGTLVRLTVGAYLYEQHGFITSLIYDVPQESPWEISINEQGGADSTVGELPHMVKVTMMFTPVHNFLVQKPNAANTPDERYIALSRNYGKGLYNLNYRKYKADGDGDSNNTNNIPGE